jgi:hypothetical protein
MTVKKNDIYLAAWFHLVRISHIFASAGTNSSTAISGKQLNLTGIIVQPIPFEIKTLVPRGEVFRPLE